MWNRAVWQDCWRGGHGSPAGAAGISPGRQARDREVHGSRAPYGATGPFAGVRSCRPYGTWRELCSGVPDLTVRANSDRPCGADDLDIGGVVELGGDIFAGENLYGFHGTMVPEDGW